MSDIKRIPFANEIDERLIEKLKERKRTHRISIGQTIEDALNEYFNKLEGNNE